jgi:hypothetical protein
VAEGSCLLSSWSRKGPQGSNPCLSALIPHTPRANCFLSQQIWHCMSCGQLRTLFVHHRYLLHRWGNMKALLILTVTLVLLAFCWACDDDNPTKPEPEPKHADFPDSAGLVWAYEVEDSVESSGEPQPTIETVLVAIEGTKALANHDSARVWVYHYSDRADTTYVYAIGDSVYFLRDTASMMPYQTFIFPLEVGKEWVEDEYYQDTTRIDSSGTVTTPAGQFQDAYRVVKTWGGMADNAGSIRTWLVQGEGIVKRDEYRVTIAGLRTSKWERIPLPAD